MTDLVRGTRKGAPHALPLILLSLSVGFCAQWTVGLYMCADNELLNYRAYEDLAEMMAVGSTDEVNIVVQVDNVARDTHPECRRYLVTKGTLQPLGELRFANHIAIDHGALSCELDLDILNFFLFLFRLFAARELLPSPRIGLHRGADEKEHDQIERDVPGRAGWRFDKQLVFAATFHCRYLLRPGACRRPFAE